MNLINIELYVQYDGNRLLDLFFLLQWQIYKNFPEGKVKPHWVCIENPAILHKDSSFKIVLFMAIFIQTLIPHLQYHPKNWHTSENNDKLLDFSSCMVTKFSNTLG